VASTHPPAQGLRVGVPTPTNGGWGDPPTYPHKWEVGPPTRLFHLPTFLFFPYFGCLFFKGIIESLYGSS
jgi:hypothetical protein